MASFSFLLSLALVTLVVDQSFAQSYDQRVTLYSGSDCTGSFLTISAQYANDLTTNGWNNFAYSARLTGVWNFYDLVNFNANNNAVMEYAFGPNQFCINFNNLRARVTSLRFSGSPNDYRSNTLTLYKGTYFQDQEEYYIANQANVVLQQHASLVITGSSAWTLYDQPSYRGNAICVYPPDNRYTPALVFDLTSIDVPHNKIRSVAIGCYGKKIVRPSVATRGASLDQATDSLSASDSGSQ
jgi:hypothetical protein